MDALNLNNQLGAVEIDDKVFIDLDALLEVLYNSCKHSADLATERKDPTMLIMIAGMTTMCDVVEKIHTELKNRLKVRS